MNLHVNNVCYVRWVLDTFSVDFLQKNMVKEVNVSFLAEAKEGDRVGVCLVEEQDKRYQVTVLREADKKELAKVKLHFG